MSYKNNKDKEDNKEISLKIKSSKLEEHVKRICRSNLKKPAKICTQCPILGPVIDIMEKYDWKYNEKAMKESIEKYYENY